MVTSHTKHLEFDFPGTAGLDWPKNFSGPPTSPAPPDATFEESAEEDADGTKLNLPIEFTGRPEELLVNLISADPRSTKTDIDPRSTRDRPEIDPRSTRVWPEIDMTKFGRFPLKLLVGRGKFSDPPTVTAM